jgi:hypothetical protein
MEELIMRAARELGMDSNVSVREFADSIEPLVTVTFPPKAVQTRISWNLFLERNLTQVKLILSDMAKMAKNN